MRLYDLETVLRQIHTHILTTEWRDEFAPPEGQPGYTGPDPMTELQGFKRDADRIVMGPLRAAFQQAKSNGSFYPKISEQNLFDILDNAKPEDPARGEGPFITFLVKELKETFCSNILSAPRPHSIDHPQTGGSPFSFDYT